MSKLKFRITEYEKYNTKRVGILYGQFKLNEDCEILEVHNTSYDYKKAVVKLSPEKADIMKGFEDEVNDFLEKKQYTKGDRSAEKLKNIKIKGVFVNDENKLFPQLWLEY